MNSFARLQFPLCALALLISVANGGVDGAEPGPRDKDAPDEFTTTDSGLKYRILRKGDGERPTEKSEVTVHYQGWLDDNTVFDSSYKRGDSATFRLQAVIPGWTEGMQLVRKGGMIELEIPSKLGYGKRGAGRIPPDATLHFIVELIEVVTPVEPGPADPDAPEEFTAAESGVKYRIRRKGDGRKPRPEETVTVHYKGWLDDGTVFGSTYKSGKPISFSWSEVVESWSEVMKHLHQGGMIELEIPSELAYGPKGDAGRIPPNARLHFLIELIEIH